MPYYQDQIQLCHEPHRVKVELTVCAALTLRGDRHRLRQLQLKLVDNAIRYNAPGGEVTLALRRADDEAVFISANTGIGTPPKLLPKVFDRFFRGDTSHNTAVDGCGRGLGIAPGLVSAHRGSILIASEPAKVTTVTVRLPLPPAT